MSTEVVRSQTPEEEELARKLAELGLLEAELADRELELATLLSELHLFERRYLRAVGARHAELDGLRAQIAEAKVKRTDDPIAQREAAEARKQAEESAETAGTIGDGRKNKFEPPEKLKKLYREVAKRIHPDLATNEEERGRRTRLMAEVNRAYEEGNEARLRTILREWESSPEAVPGEGPGAELVRTIRKIAQVRSRLDAIRDEMDQMKESPLYALKLKVEQADAEGRDLLTEMAEALDWHIVEAREELSRDKQKAVSV